MSAPYTTTHPCRCGYDGNGPHQEAANANG